MALSLSPRHAPQTTIVRTAAALSPGVPPRGSRGKCLACSRGRNTLRSSSMATYSLSKVSAPPIFSWMSLVASVRMCHDSLIAPGHDALQPLPRIALLTPTRKNMRHLASQFQLTCLRLRHRVEELFAFLKNAFGLVRTTHRAVYALPIHLLCGLLAYSLYNSLIV